MDQLKDYCRVRSLPVAGSRFDLILRIIQYDKDAKESASSQKRKADSSGGPPKKKSTAAAETPDLTDAATTKTSASTTTGDLASPRRLEKEED